MQKSTRIIVLSLAAAGAAAAVLVNTSAGRTTAAPTSNDFDATAATEQRIRALETAVSEERRARQLLEEELLAIYAELEVLQANRPTGATGDAPAQPAIGMVNTEGGPAELREFRRERPEDRRAAMVEAGMPPQRADYILQRESEIRYESMQAVFEARNNGESVDRFNPDMHPDAMLRAEIGDSDYERYLEATGRPTSVGVSSVMASSPAERAGLQSGDQIVGYDGERVFSSFDLMQRTMAGGDGNVVVDVIRDGSPIQIVVPRGPIGVEIGRFRGR